MKIVRNLIISPHPPENKNDGWLKPNDEISGTYKLYIFSDKGWESVIAEDTQSV